MKLLVIFTKKKIIIQSCTIVVRAKRAKGRWAFWQMVLEQVHIHMQNQKIVVFYKK